MMDPRATSGASSTAPPPGRPTQGGGLFDISDAFEMPSIAEAAVPGGVPDNDQGGICEVCKLQSGDMDPTGLTNNLERV